MAMKAARYTVERDTFCLECAEALARDYVMRAVCDVEIAGACGRCGARPVAVRRYLYTMSKAGYDRLGVPYP